MKEIKGLQGFYEIPEYSNYAISKKGIVINITSGKTLNGSINPAGYLNIRIKHDNGFTLTWGLHRLLCYVFKPIDDIKHMVVNHLDGNKANNSLENLEWVTYTQNLEHAGMNNLTSKCIPISVRDVKTGIVEKFPSVIACSRKFGMTKDAILHRIKQGETRIFPELKQYRVGHEDYEWYIPTDLRILLDKNGKYKKVLVRFCLTGTIELFESLSSVSLFLNQPLSKLSRWVSKPHQPVLPGYVQLKWNTDDSPWRIPENPIKELEDFNGTRSVSVYDEQTMFRKRYSSIKECAEDLNISSSCLIYRLNTNGNIVFDGKRFYYT